MGCLRNPSARGSAPAHDGVFLQPSLDFPPVRGFAAGQIIVTILLTNFNLRKIAAFISDKIKEDAKREASGEPAIAKMRRRDREWHNAYTGTYPPGVLPPEKPESRAPSDETGGPPLRT